MRHLDFRVELLSDVVITARNATEGGHECLDYLPGSVFLGAAARVLYDSLGPEAAFTVFHSGRVRFLPALPEIEAGVATVPTPLSFHVEKGGGEVLNLAADSVEHLVQPKQQREGFLSAKGLPSEESGKRYSLKVSVLPTREDAADKKALFGYEALPAGLILRCSVHLDDDVPAALDGQLLKALTDKPINVGRSRRAEYGRARLTPGAQATGLEAAGSGGRLSLLCVTDVALVDAGTLLPTLEPRPEHFGLPAGWTLDRDRTFLRSRVYSPFNGKRRRPDLERHVLVAGSVITFAGTGNVDLAAVRAHVAGGVGAWRSDGLGQVAVQPQLLAAPKPALRAHAEAKQGAVAQLPHDPLVAWIDGMDKAAADAEKAYVLSQKWAEALAPFAKVRGGPGAAQWGFVRELAACAKDGAALAAQLFAEDGHLRQRKRALSWQVRRGKKQAIKVFEELARDPDVPPSLLPVVVRLTAARVTRQLRARD